MISLRFASERTAETADRYWKAFSKYNHALYITNVSKEKPETHTELNYQFLSTVSMEADEFRPADLPDGWKISPASVSYTHLDVYKRQ